MKTYYDYTEKERSAMTEEKVRSFIDAELMLKGVLKVSPLQLKTVKEIPELKTTAYFEVYDVLFDTMEKAVAFLSLKPQRKNYEWSAGNKYYYADYFYGSEIKQISIVEKQEYLNMAKVLKEIEEAKNYNDKAQEEYSKKCEDSQRVINEMFEDWYRCINIAEKMRRVLKTREEYLALTNNDVEMAETFLGKVFSADVIKEANEWEQK